MSIEVSMLVDRAAILAYAAITDDFNPIHIDPDLAASTVFARPIAHGMLSPNLIWQALRGGPGLSVPMSLDVRFLAPVLEGTRIVAGWRPREGCGGYHVWVRDDAGLALIEGLAVPRTHVG
jgi:acyl dehydratase